MELQKKGLSSLHSRVNDFLRGKPEAYMVEESEEAIETIFEQLRKAEQDLKAVQERIDRLRWELAKVKSPSP